MCEPVSASTAFYTSLALTAASTAGTFYSQGAAAKAQGEYQNAEVEARNQQMAENDKLARQSYYLQTGQIDQRDMQADAAAQMNIQQNGTEAAKARATARVSSGEAGVAGLSVEALLADFSRQESNYRDSGMHNRDNERAQLQWEKEGKRAEAEGRIQSVRPYTASPIKQPDYLGSALRIGTGGWDAFERYSAKTTDPTTGETRYRLR